MTSTCSKIALVVVGLAFAGAPAVAGAQQQDEQTDSTTSEASDSQADNSTDASNSEPDEPSSDDDQQTADNQSETDAAADTDQQQVAEDSDSESGENADSSDTPQKGPGGRKMRDDYPAKNEAKQSQMETDRLEGLQFKEGQDPAEAYDVQIQELETQIDDLKEKVFQSKSRVVLLKETVLGGNLSGSRAVIKHVSGLGGRFKLHRAMYSLDGNRVFNQSKKSGELPGVKEFTVYDDSITTGQHNVSVQLEYRGSGFGIFNYMDGYRFEITSSCQLSAEAGKATVLRIHAVDKAGAFADVEKKPGIRCEIKKRDLTEQRAGNNSESSSADQNNRPTNDGG